MQAALKEAHQARLSRLQSKWSRMRFECAFARADLVDGTSSGSDSGSPSVSVLAMERVGETIGSILWEGCVALMAHLVRIQGAHANSGTRGAAHSVASSVVASSLSSIRTPSAPLSLSGARVLELGAGVGVLGCLAAMMGGAVTITDRSEILHVIRENIEVNRVQDRAQCAELEWGGGLAGAHAPFDIILASDVVYNLSAAWLLLDTLKAVSGENTIILLAYRERDPAEAAWFTRAALDFDVQLETVDPDWKQHVTFETLDSPPSATAPSSSSAPRSSSVQTAAAKYHQDMRPLLIYRLQRKRAVT